MKLIIEGCDGTGKTTLAKKLAEKYNIKSYIHVTKDDPNSFPFYYETLGKNDVIFDRHFIGEMVYPKIFNRMGQLNSLAFERLLDRAIGNGYKIVILYSDDDTIKQRLAETEYKEVINNISEINSRFIAIARNYGITLINTAEDSFEHICELIENA